MESLFPEDQASLFTAEELEGDASCSATASKVAFQLASAFHSGYLARDTPSRLPDDLDVIGLACLLVVSDYTPPAAPRLVHELIFCRNCLQTQKAWRDLDALPFDTCLQLLGMPYDGLDRIKSNLNHGMSSAPAFYYEVAWMCRKHLTVDRIGNLGGVYQLLRTAESAILYWDMALVLCRTMYPTAEAFWDGIGFFEARDFPDQYAGRLKWARDNPKTFEADGPFVGLELRVRRELDRVTFTSEAI